jgi:hypothetical protein
VEEWLGSVESDMVRTIREELKEGYFDYDEDPFHRAEWTKHHMSQVVSVVCQIMWTASTEEVLNA